MSRSNKRQKLSRKQFLLRLTDHLISLVGEEKADQMINTYSAEIERCFKTKWQPETAATALMLGLFDQNKTEL